MPGSIKIDDGSGNYTILTNAGSLGSDKTITIPNETATLATTTATDLGAKVLLKSATASSSSEIVMDNFTDETKYSHYEIVCSKVRPATDDTNLKCIFRSGGASGSDMTGTYKYTVVSRYTDLSSSATGTNSSYTDCTKLLTNMSNTSGECSSGVGLFFPDGSKMTPSLRFNALVQRAGGEHQYTQRDYSFDSATVATGLRFTMESGNIAEGEFRIYGVRL